VTEPVVETIGLTVKLGGETVLKDVDLKVRRGETVALTGVNGAGKSTLLRCLAGLQRPSGGEVRVLGREPEDNPGFWREVAVSGDEPSWYPGLSAAEHLELMGTVHQGSRMSVAEALESFGLTARADSPPINYSTGQRQRLTLAAALMRPSSLLLLDEPERGLDRDFRDRLGHLLSEYPGTVVMATHSAELAARGREVALT
jgi:ABC-2 type transport system ATP-binding protein